ncbi:MAG: hypothetical protein M1828_004877 [Chrysothrix sp. TS-e1954]|nr:MAG: hypothetical protein M1828_004877 [Chrysothrix sp. TS-e1954]
MAGSWRVDPWTHEAEHPSTYTMLDRVRETIAGKYIDVLPSRGRGTRGICRFVFPVSALSITRDPGQLLQNHMLALKCPGFGVHDDAIHDEMSILLITPRREQRIVHMLDFDRRGQWWTAKLIRGHILRDCWELVPEGYLSPAFVWHIFAQIVEVMIHLQYPSGRRVSMTYNNLEDDHVLFDLTLPSSFATFPEIRLIDFSLGVSHRGRKCGDSHKANANRQDAYIDCRINDTLRLHREMLVLTEHVGNPPGVPLFDFQEEDAEFNDWMTVLEDYQVVTASQLEQLLRFCKLRRTKAFFTNSRHYPRSLFEDKTLTAEDVRNALVRSGL